MKKSWIISLITSFVLLGGVLLSPATSVNAAKEATSTYSDQSYSENEDDFSEEFADESAFSEAEQELVDYLNQILALETYVAKTSTALESIGSQVTSPNRKSIYLKLTNTVIPNYSKFVSKLKQIKPVNPELKKIHARFVKGSYTQLEGYLLYKQAVSKTKVNYTILKQGSAKIKTGGDLIDQSEQQLYAYARSLGFEF
ncbi:hypothetical protein HF638_27770 [Paenibacillus sp. SZ31]|uniref:hypothetical protein n=1 Tax=Paenibacillus sp. SZ31 TaxID=2725555 RepID=UPI00146DB3D4|nr:hypothetical protein [Paenibacillus sp. SZ31]NMI07799.1 hypothetical protein [Paenibacillus sp. SZ31]